MEDALSQARALIKQLCDGAATEYIDTEPQSTKQSTKQIAAARGYQPIRYLLAAS